MYKRVLTVLLVASLSVTFAESYVNYIKAISAEYLSVAGKTLIEVVIFGAFIVYVIVTIMICSFIYDYIKSKGRGERE